MSKTLTNIPGSKAFRKALEAIKTFVRTSTTAVTLTETLTLTELEFISTSRKPVKVKKLALAAVDTAGGVAAFTPGLACIIQRVYVDVTTIATGACTLSVGPAANATTLNATLIDTLDVHSATGLFDNIINHGTNGLAQVRCGATQSITVSKQSGATAGLVGNVYIEYIEI